MSTTRENRIMIYGPKNDGTYIVEFKTAEGEALASRRPSAALAACLAMCAGLIYLRRPMPSRDPP
jgi:hypothetical protein